VRAGDVVLLRTGWGGGQRHSHIEALNIEELSRAGVHEFVFVAAPMKIRGATGAPIRPFAMVD
jgi:kynurenine formamidase